MHLSTVVAADITDLSSQKKVVSVLMISSLNILC